MLGPFVLLETFQFYDQPVIFACHDSAGQLFLAMLDNDEDADEAVETWLYVRLTAERLEALRVCEVDLYDAFKSAEDGYVYEVVTRSNMLQPESARQIACVDLPNSWLPMEGDCLIESDDDD